jgi:predicted O-linked N-acetylglucosamine transferase (SPINDLY family)
MNRKQRRVASKQSQPERVDPAAAAASLYETAMSRLHAGRIDEAAAQLRQVVSLQPDSVAAHVNLGLALQGQGKQAEAVAHTMMAGCLCPDILEVQSNLGLAFIVVGRLDDAGRCFARAIRIRSDVAEVHNNFANLLKDLGHLDEAMRSYAWALRLNPGYVAAFSNMIMASHYMTRFSAADILVAARRFGANCRPAPVTFAARAATRSRLRIGYVSGDFRSHPVGHFLGAVLPAHRRDAVEIFCYSNNPVVDATTGQLRAAADHWRNIAMLPNREALDLIRRDGIDILVDLSGHTACNRLPLFGLRAAPVQATWLGYFGTTGVDAIDYIIADRFVVPDGEDGFYSERVWRLPGCYLCYAPHKLDIAVAPPPAAKNHHITFGCFNYFAKISAETIVIWSNILNAVGGSRLFLKAKGLDQPSARRSVENRFAAHGIAPERLRLEGYSPLAEALAAYNDVDIALDPFPFGGCTTTADTLWMGVPVVTLRGQRWSGRMSQTILACLGLDAWVADTPEGYAAIAVDLASDLAGLAAWRALLRPRLLASPFCDGRTFTAGLEDAFRGMWAERSGAE